MKRVLLIGSTGTFGSRLAQHLSKMPELHVFLASRNIERADAIATSLKATGTRAEISTVALDVKHNFTATLETIRPWLVIDTSGPFQTAGYNVARAALEADAHYFDLADAREFLLGFEGALNSIANEKGLVARAGCSTTPAITTAVVDDLTKGWKRIDTVDVALIPGGNNMVGPALAEAVLLQAGVPVEQFRHGVLDTVHGWLKSKQVYVPRLGTFRAAPAETVDPVIMPQRYGLTSRMSFRAGLVSGLEQRGFETIAWLRRRGLFQNVGTLSKILVQGRKLTRLWSHDRGGLVITVTGLNPEGKWTETNWSLLAEKGNGPHVPILPIVAAVRMLLAGQFTKGARMITGEIPLSHITDLFPALSISTQTKQSRCSAGAFETAMGPQAYASLPGVIRAFHDPAGYPVWQGEASVERGTSLASRIVAKVMGLPKAGQGHTVKVSVERQADASEVWTREFSGKKFSSKLTLGKDSKLQESFGPTTFTLGLTGSALGSDLPILDGRAFGIPIPRFFLPTSTAREFVDEQGRFRFDVRLDLPIFGLLVHYRGWLAPAK
jgi:NAD(P)-dependent dehydrogenase (short-subunit alcohol dehydrogenase family)